MAASPKLDPQVPETPLEAPVAPTQREWDALTPERRAEVIDALVCSESEEEIEERFAMSEGDEHYDNKEEARDTLRRFFRRGQVYVGADRKVYYPGRKGFTPDIIVVVGVSPHNRDCWMVSAEGRGIDVIIEVHYKGDWRKDFVQNVEKYAALGVPEYFIYDVRRKALTAYRLPAEGSAYVPIPRKAGSHHSEKLGLALGVRRGKLRFFQGDSLLPTRDEWVADLEDIAEQEQARAEQEQARAEQEQLRADEEHARVEHACARLADGILTVARIRQLPLADGDVARIRASRDIDVLSGWMTRVASATAEEFAAGVFFLDS